MSHKIWKCMKCNIIPETGLENENGICKKCGEKIIKVEPSKEERMQHIRAVEQKCGNMSYDEELKQTCKLFDLHDFALPYIPENYGKNGCNKVLHIGESNYIAGDMYESVLREFFLNHWWNEKIDIKNLMNTCYEACWDGDYTRYVIDSFGKGYSDYFENFKLIGEIFFRMKGIQCPDEPMVREWYFANVAYTDLYKMPCTKVGKSFMPEMREQRKRERFTKLETQTFNSSVRLNSIACMNATIEILDPDVVLFGTIDGYNCYTNKRYNKEYERLCKNRHIYCLYHPNYIERRVKREDKKIYYDNWEKAVKKAFLQ